MSVRQLHDWLDAYLAYTECTEPPKRYHIWCGIATIAACLQRKVWIPWEHNVLYPNFFILLVGPSGRTRKGTAMGIAQQLLRSTGIPFVAQSITEAALIKYMVENRHTSFTADQTLTIDHCSTTIFSKEFTVFLGYHEEERLVDLCDWYDCDDEWIKRTIIRDAEGIVGLWVNMIGATTPHALQQALPITAIGGGFTSRIIFVCERQKRKGVSPWAKSIDNLRTMQDRLISDLHAIYALIGEFSLTPEAIDFFDDWYLGGEAERSGIKDPKFDGYNSRRQTHIAKLAMVLSAARDDEMIIQQSDIKRAIDLLKDVEHQMHWAFDGIGIHPLAGKQADVLEFIREEAKHHPHNHVLPRRILDAFSSDIDASENGVYSLSQILATLEARNKIAIVRREPEDRDYIKYLGVANEF